MECVQNLLLGDPVYDERGQLVRREYGLKNALALFVLGYVAYTLYISMGKKVFSGKRKGRRKGKMKGGGGSGSDGDADSNPDGEADGGSSSQSVSSSLKTKVNSRILANWFFAISLIYCLAMLVWFFIDPEGSTQSIFLPAAGGIFCVSVSLFFILGGPQ